MLVDVIQMRVEGEKLPPAQLKGVAPIRGRLSIKTRPWNHSGLSHEQKELVTFASLYDHLEDDPIAEPVRVLRQARINSLEGDEFVIVGMESTGQGEYERDDVQAWWCKRVKDRGAADALSQRDAT